MSKKKLGWWGLIIFVIAALSFAGYQFYREKTAATRRETEQVFQRKLNNLYLDQKSGYFKDTISEEDFDHLLNELAARTGQNQSMEERIAGSKADFRLQTQMNQLFEKSVLTGMDLSAHPVLQTIDTNDRITRLAGQLQTSTAKKKSWGQDIEAILSIAKNQASHYQAAEQTVTKLTRKKAADITLSDYLSTVQTVAILPDGNFKEDLLNQLNPIKRKLSENNQDFSTEVQQKEAEIEAAAKDYQARQTKELETKTEQLNTLKKELAQKQRTYASLSRMKVSLENSRSRSRSLESSSESSTTSTTIENGEVIIVPGDSTNTRPSSSSSSSTSTSSAPPMESSTSSSVSDDEQQIAPAGVTNH